MKTLKCEVRVPFFDADPAGILFYGNVFRIVHAAYEELLPQMGISWQEWFNHPKWAVPVRHASADYRSPIFPGEKYEVALTLKKLGDSSLQWQASIQQGTQVCCQIDLVATFMDRVTKTKAAIPVEFRSKLAKYCDS